MVSYYIIYLILSYHIISYHIIHVAAPFNGIERGLKYFNFMKRAVFLVMYKYSVPKSQKAPSVTVINQEFDVSKEVINIYYSSLTRHLYTLYGKYSVP